MSEDTDAGTQDSTDVDSTTSTDDRPTPPVDDAEREVKKLKKLKKAQGVRIELRYWVDRVGLDGLIGVLTRSELNTIGAYAFGGATGGTPDGDGDGGADVGGGDGDGGTGAADDNPAPPVDDAEKKRLEREVKKLKKAQADREAREKEAADKKALDEGKAKELLTEREKELESLRGELDSLKEAEQKRVDATFGKLPKASQDKLEMVREKLGLADFAALVDAEAATITASAGARADDTKPLPPAAGGSTPNSAGESMHHNPSNEAIDFLTEAGRPGAIEALKSMSFVHKEGQGSSLIKHPGTRQFIDEIKSRAFRKYTVVPKK